MKNVKKREKNVNKNKKNIKDVFTSMILVACIINQISYFNFFSCVIVSRKRKKTFIYIYGYDSKAILLLL